MVKCAKKAWDDAAGSSSRVAKCPVVERMKGMNEANAEEQMHPVLRKYNLSLPVDLSPISGGLLDQYPRLKPIDFLEYMRESGRPTAFLGASRLLVHVSNWNSFGRIMNSATQTSDFFLKKVSTTVCASQYLHTLMVAEGTRSQSSWFSTGAL